MPEEVQQENCIVLNNQLCISGFLCLQELTWVGVLGARQGLLRVHESLSHAEPAWRSAQHWNVVRIRITSHPVTRPVPGQTSRPITIYNATQQTPNSHKTPGTYRDDLPGLFTFVASCFHNAKRPRLLFEDSVFCWLFAPVFPVYQLTGTRSLFSVRGSPSEGASQKGAYKGFTFWFCIVLGLVEHVRLRLFRKLAFFFPSEYKKQNK